MRLVHALGLALVCAGCSIRPLPQDVTGADTYRIVQNVRCETRDAIRSYIRGVLNKTDPEIAEKLRAGTLGYDFDRRILSRDAQAVFDKYDQAAIAYDFTFDITEKNNATVSASFLSTLTAGMLTLGPSATSNLQRQNTRNFRSGDTFEELATQVSEDYCQNVRSGPNYIYPITGSIGMVELVGAFLDLNQSGRLIGPKDNANVPQIADTIAFTTTFSASVNPTVVLTPVKRGFEFTGGGLSTDASRSDLHRVIVAISLPPEPAKTKHRAAIRAGARSAQAGANAMIDEQIYRSLINVRPIIAIQ